MCQAIGGTARLWRPRFHTDATAAWPRALDRIRHRGGRDRCAVSGGAASDRPTGPPGQIDASQADRARAQGRGGGCCPDLRVLSYEGAANPDEAIEIPPPTKRRLGLDAERSWIIVSEIGVEGPSVRKRTVRNENMGAIPAAPA